MGKPASAEAEVSSPHDANPVTFGSSVTNVPMSLGSVPRELCQQLQTTLRLKPLLPSRGLLFRQRRGRLQDAVSIHT